MRPTVAKGGNRFITPWGGLVFVVPQFSALLQPQQKPSGAFQRLLAHFFGAACRVRNGRYSTESATMAV
jgi:hypothetical protein